MKLLRTLGLVMLIMGMVGLLGSTIARQVYTSKAQLIQRATPADPDVATLTGETVNPIGEPQLMIIEDPKAFLPDKGEGGAKLVDDTYLKKNGIYPLQLKTVNFTSQVAMLASLVVAVLGGLTAWAANRKQKSRKGGG